MLFQPFLGKKQPIPIYYIPITNLGTYIYIIKITILNLIFRLKK